MSSCHDPLQEPKLIQDMRAMANDINDHDKRIDDLENICAEKRLIQLESAHLANCLDPKVWVHVNERLEKLEDFGAGPIVASLKSVDEKVKETEKRVKDIEYRLFHIVELPSELDIRLQDVERRIDKIPDNYTRRDKEISKRIDDIENGLINRVGILGKALHDFSELSIRMDQLETELNTVRTLGSRAYHPKKPHKCPVCNGQGKFLTQSALLEPFEKRIIDSAGRHFTLCNGCEGKGIVWG
jgi:DNA repair exonuclease SbcCD ATPase subunit